MQTSRLHLQSLCYVTWSHLWAAGVLPPESICCTCHCCISNALQNVKGSVCKVMVLRTAILSMTRTPYLHLVLRDCTPSHFIFTPRTDILCFIIAVPFVHANWARTTSCRSTFCGTVQRYLLCLCRSQSMARFASEGEVETFLGRLDPDYSQFASALWQKGVRTAHQLVNVREPFLLSCGLSELYIDDIKARAARTGELHALKACTVCLIVHRCWVHLYCSICRHKGLDP